MSTSTIGNLEKAIEAERKAGAARIAKLRNAAAKEQRRVDDSVLELLRAQNSEQYNHLVEQAQQQLESARTERSLRARRIPTLRRPEDAPAASAGLGEGQHSEARDEHQS